VKSDCFNEISFVNYFLLINDKKYKIVTVFLNEATLQVYSLIASLDNSVYKK